MTNTDRHAATCRELTALYQLKNHDYGDSFHQSFLEYGHLMVIIRLEDKLNRLKTLCPGAERQVPDESVRDTLLDIANYALMAVMELDGGEVRPPPDRPQNPFRKGSVIWALMEGTLQETFESLPGWSDLTLRQIAEVLDVEDCAVRRAIYTVRRKTRLSVPHTRAKPGRPLDE